ncbi:thiamine pyrophosphate-requiring protein [Deinococcus oregonensis]|uniref:Thiamine pyrophosphate-requiring protein n=1 Tax=Deinococcus oregonensis TaxID=1805970 RepID=A0ABV6B0W4_9DEIO
MTGGPKLVADALVERLRGWHVEKLYGYAGDGINGLLGALGRAGNRPEFIHAVHEELASFMATAHAKFTGEVGVCTATSGPGAIHLLNGLYDAKLDHQPVVAILGQQPGVALGSGYLQEVDLAVLFKDVASDFLGVMTHPAQLHHLVDRAFRVALERRAPTAIIIPQSVQELPAPEGLPHEHGFQHSGIGYSAPRILPREEDLRRAAEVLNAGKRVALLVGAGALQATDEVIAVAETLGAGVAKALLGKAAVPDDLPFVTGSVGWLGTAASNWMMQECDTLLMVGSSFPYTEYLPREGQARGVQIDREAKTLSLRYPMEVPLVGDSTETLHALLPLLERKTNTSWRQETEARVAAWWEEAERRAAQPAQPLNPQLVVSELSKRLPDDAILSGDSGTAAVWIARNVRLRRGMKVSLSGGLASMGSGVPYALAAKINFPDRLAVALVGDGAMQMSGNAALLAVAQRWQTWADPRLVIVVFNNRDLNYVTWEQRVMGGTPRFGPSQNLFDFPFARYAELLGLRGVRVDAPQGVAAAWDEALSADRPVVLEAYVDANVPTLPAELRPGQRDHLEQALGQGDPDAVGVREQLILQGVTEKT